MSARDLIRSRRLGSFARLSPISAMFGDDRGQPVDRYYIEQFLSRHSGAVGYAPGAIRGRILEVGDDSYARRYADLARVEAIDVLDAADNPNATVVADLTDAPELATASYDCVICTQTLLLIYDARAAIATLHRILKPGGTLLATVPGISQICRPDMDVWGDYWRFTSTSLRRLAESAFEPAGVTVEAYGNVLAATAFLYGLAAGELRRDELDARDPDYELLLALRADRGATG